MEGMARLMVACTPQAEDKKTVATWRTTGVKGQITVIKKEESGWNGKAKSGNGGKWRSGMTFDKLEGTNPLLKAGQGLRLKGTNPIFKAGQGLGSRVQTPSSRQDRV